MKILIIENNLAGGGAEKVLLTILEELKPPQYDVTLLLIKNKGVYINSVPEHVKVQYMLDVSEGDIPFPKDRNMLTHYYEKHIGNEFDVEIAFLEGPPTKLLSCSTNRNSLKIAWVHTDLQKAHWTYSYFSSLQDERFSYDRMDELVFVSPNARNGFEELFDLKLENAIIIKNPINQTKIRALAENYTVNYEGFSCVIVGSLCNRKGQSRLLFAMGRLIELGYNFHLYVVGEGSEERSYRELAHLLNISDNVHFVGFQTNPYPYIKSANILISSSITEGYPLVLCEALSLGVPVIGTRCTGNIDVLNDGKYGMLVDNSEEGLFLGLKEVLDSPQLYEDLRKKSLLGETEIQYDERICLIKELMKRGKNNYV
ncbi:MAG: glycosyltransferase [Lachnospiraceae bacterium]